MQWRRELRRWRWVQCIGDWIYWENHMRLYLLVATLVLIVDISAFAESERVRPDANIQVHIGNLAHDDPSVRDAAAAALVKLGPVVVDPLTRAMEQTESPEF